MREESLFDLIDSAKQMLLDRPKDVQDLIYFVAKLDNEERTAIIFAYNFLHRKDENRD